MIQKGVKIEAPSGKLGVLIPGLGAVSTTFIAGVEAVKKKDRAADRFADPTRNDSARKAHGASGFRRFKDFVPLAGLNDLVFGGWDIYEDNCYESAVKAGVLEKVAAGRRSARDRKNQTVESRFQPGLRQTTARPQREVRQEQDGACRTGDGRHRAVPQSRTTSPEWSWSGAEAPRST